ncbi:vomeromodulin-like [Callithrix jacchus]
MLTLWVLAVILAIQEEALGQLNLPASPPIIPNLPVSLLPGLPIPIPPGLPVPLPPGSPPGGLQVPKVPLPRKYPARTKGSRCLPIAKYFISDSKLEDHMNATLPPQIEKMLKCKKVDLAGLLGTVLSAVSDLDLLSLLDLTSSLDILGGGSLGGLLGEGNGGKSSNLPLLPEVTGAVSGLLTQRTEGLGSLLSTGSDKNLVKGLLDGTGLSALQQPLNDVTDKVGDLKESAQGVLNSTLLSGISSGLSDLLKNADLEQLLLGLQVEKVTVESMKSTMTADGIHVQATTTIFIGGNGLLGPVLSLVGFNVHGDVALKIGLSTNDTHCVKLQVQEKAFEVNKVTLQLIQTVTDILPLSLPLPLDDVVLQLLTVKISKNMEEPRSCDIVLSDISECKNSMGLFTYSFKSSRMSPQGLSTFYCAEARFNKGAVAVPGSSLSSVTKNASISLILSHMMLKAIITHTAKQSSVQRNNLDARITKLTYSHQLANQIQASYWVNISKDGERPVTGKTDLIISLVCKISKDKLITDIRLLSSEHSTTPPDAIDQVQGEMAEVLKKFSSGLTEYVKQWNIPPPVISNLLDNVNFEVLKSKDLQAAK